MILSRAQHQTSSRRARRSSKVAVLLLLAFVQTLLLNLQAQFHLASESHSPFERAHIHLSHEPHESLFGHYHQGNDAPQQQLSSDVPNAVINDVSNDFHNDFHDDEHNHLHLLSLVGHQHAHLDDTLAHSRPAMFSQHYHTLAHSPLLPPPNAA